MSRFFRFFVFFAAVLGAFPLAHADEKPVVTLGLLVFPPEVVVDSETGKCLGEVIDISKLVLKNFNVDVVCAPPARIYRLLEQGVVDLTINIKTTDALQDKVKFTNIPYRFLVTNLYGHKDKQDAGSVSAIRGFDYNGTRGKLASDGYQFIDLPTSTDAIRMFARGRSEYLLSYESPVKFLLDEFPEKYSVKTLQSVPTFYAVSNVSPHQEQLLQRLNSVADALSLDTFLELRSHAFLSE
ncbi:substrate-binding periplasmic protein [Aestuariibacter salexigens]|uniref:substrate-binding periplasmic protein n=1 Tax=Aestuariibacter salexigens TaxID=226010 RepID=UPI0004088E22|nr:transporter substrate-binding domain-containing protein [Aestuariibacter salexigens]